VSKAKKHMGRVAGLGCLICRDWFNTPDSPAQVHHLFDTASRSDWLVAPLCPEHHKGATGFHGLGQREFERRYKTTEAKLLAMTIEALQ
jgi:hypothetical protein